MTEEQNEQLKKEWDEMVIHETWCNSRMFKNEPCHCTRFDEFEWFQLKLTELEREHREEVIKVISNSFENGWYCGTQEYSLDELYEEKKKLQNKYIKEKE